MNEQWLKCTLLDGMFSSEAVVQTSGMSFFVDADQTQKDLGNQGKVRVRTFEREGTLWAILPTESVDVIQIQKNQLEGILG